MKNIKIICVELKEEFKSFAECKKIMQEKYSIKIDGSNIKRVLNNPNKTSSKAIINNKIVSLHWQSIEE